MADEYHLQRFLDAQAGTFETACAELKTGRKLGHWMWFIFPQIRGLGSSQNARFYAISSRAEAEAYLAHPILGPRLVQATGLAMSVDGRTLREIFDTPDDMKFGSCMTLFDAVGSSSDTIYARALDRFCAGVRDGRTIEILRAG